MVFAWRFQVLCTLAIALIIGLPPVSSTSESAPAISTASGIAPAAAPPAEVTSAGAEPSAPPLVFANVALSATVDSTILILVREGDATYSVTSGLDAYGIPYELVFVPRTGFNLPSLNTSSTQGNYGGIISLSELSFGYDSGFSSGISNDQYNTIYAYQIAFGVRFVRINAFPQPTFGTTTAPQGSGCCSTDVDQFISITNDTGFATANIKTGATLTSRNIYHYPAVITDESTTWEFAKYGPAAEFTEDTTAAVINDFGGRQQMVWFGGWATDWAPASNFLQHAYIHWMTRGLFLGARKTYLSTQIDDVHLTSTMYSPSGKRFRLRPEDLVSHVAWTRDINSRMPAGSDYFVEMGHNGNGDIIEAVSVSGSECDPNRAIYYDFPPATDLEFQKPLGTGTDLWPATPARYSWSLACALYDDLAAWFTTPANRDAFAHVSHTFSHLPQNNITYSDAEKEIVFNQAWLRQLGIDQASRFSPKSLIPPAITGLHNGDAIRAWVTSGITSATGDNSRPALLNTNQHWPLISTTSRNGYSGLTITPRWPTTIYFDCDLPDCTLQEWIDTASGQGTFDDLLTFERRTTSRYLLGLRKDGYMFHQANLRQSDVDTLAVGSQTGRLSIFQAWVETVVQEMTRLTNWPILSLTQDDLTQKFNDRMARDQCSPKLSYTHSADGQSIVAVTVTANSNSCGTRIPVTLPGGAATSGAATADKVGSEPVIMWVELSGSAVTLDLPSPVRLRG